MGQFGKPQDFLATLLLQLCCCRHCSRLCTVLSPLQWVALGGTACGLHGRLNASPAHRSTCRVGKHTIKPHNIAWHWYVYTQWIHPIVAYSFLLYLSQCGVDYKPVSVEVATSDKQTKLVGIHRYSTWKNTEGSSVYQSSYFCCINLCGSEPIQTCQHWLQRFLCTKTTNP